MFSFCFVCLSLFFSMWLYFFLYHVQNKDSIHVADVAHTSSSGGLNALQLIRCLCGESTHTFFPPVVCCVWGQEVSVCCLWHENETWAAHSLDTRSNQVRQSQRALTPTFVRTWRIKRVPRRSLVSLQKPLWGRCGSLTCAGCWCAGRRWALAKVWADPADSRTRKRGSCKNTSNNYKSRRPRPPRCCLWRRPCCFWWTWARTRPGCRWRGSRWSTRWTRPICSPAAASAARSPLCPALGRWLSVWCGPEKETCSVRSHTGSRRATEPSSSRFRLTFWALSTGDTFPPLHKFKNEFICLFAENPEASLYQKPAGQSEKALRPPLTVSQSSVVSWKLFGTWSVCHMTVNLEKCCASYC